MAFAVHQSQAAYLRDNVSAVHLYDSRDVFNPDNRDALGVICKKPD
jgi:hypothetical protein